MKGGRAVGRKRGSRWLWALLFTALPAYRLTAQCPDGSPPPCASRIARAAAPSPNSVAVLYFDNLSRDTADAFLADGLTEELIIRLGQVQRLAVTSRYEVQRWRGRAVTADSRTVGRSLGAAYLVTGSVQRGGGRVRLRVALLRAGTRAQVWGDVIDRASDDLLAVESDIARQVATAIAGQLLPQERSRLDRPITTDPVAYDEYLRGLRSMNSLAESDVRTALAHFSRAIARDSAFAPAWAGLAVVWSNLADGFVTPREGYGRAREAANQALARDTLQGLARAALALATLALDLDAPAAESIARRAIAVAPRVAISHNVLNAALTARGRLDEATAETARAWELDSLVPWINRDFMFSLVERRQLDRAADLLARARPLLSAADANMIESVLRAGQGDWPAAARLADWRAYGGVVAGVKVRALVLTGNRAGALAVVDSMLAARTPGYYNPYALAQAYVALGDLDRAFEWLGRAFDERTVWLLNVLVDPDLAPMRADARFAALERQLRFR